MELRRSAYQKMKQWKQESDGSTALLLEGARRVGKSYLARKFGENEYRSCLLIDFSDVSEQVLEVFEHDGTDRDLFFNKLSVFYGVKLYPRESLIIFDEVQMYPKARQMVKHLVADGRYDYLETGSLITLKQNVEHIVIPSEEEKLTIYPLTFDEFLYAMGEDGAVDYIKDCFDQKRPMGEALHRKVMNLFRQYMLVGGMPQAVLEYVDTRNFERTDRVKRRILALYRNDVTKFAKGYESKVLSVFDGIPSQLSKHEKRYSLASIQKEARFREYEDAFIWLEEAMMINTCFNSTDPEIGLELNTERMTLKCYMADTGLLFSHAFSDQELMEEEVYKAILFDRLGLNEGMFLENMVAQMLRSRGHRLFFYSRSDREHAENRMEIDFLIRKKRKICPVEVKSSSYRNHRSLDKFQEKFRGRLGDSYIIYTRDLHVEDGIICLPVYMTMCL
ncbi:MAG: AAA family ATPase [Eubacteriales bacterium]|nr:AAA family ATPase [Eubacteriales bacterium]